MRSLAAISPNGKRIATGSSDNTVAIWDSRTGKQIYSLKGHGENRFVRVARVFERRADLYSWGDDQELHVWDAVSGNLKRKFSITRNGVRDARVGETMSQLYFARARADDLYYQFRGIVRRSLSWYSCCFVLGGKRLVLGGEDQIFVFDTQTGKEIAKRSMRAPFDSIASWGSQNGVIVTFFGMNPPVVAVDLDSGKVIWETGLPEWQCYSVTSSGDGKLVAVAAHDRRNQATIYLLDGQNGDGLKSIRGGNPEFSIYHPASFSPDRKRLAFAEKDGSVVIWDLDRLGLAGRR